MKIRNGFVSNSSSSSFVVEIDMSPAELAVDIITCRNWESRDNELIEKIQTKISQLKPNDVPIAFKSCNYDTYIMKINGSLHIETCNNHPWWDVIDEYRLPYPGEPLYDDGSIHHLTDFYWPEYDVRGRTPQYDGLKKLVEEENLNIDPFDLAYCSKCGMDRIFIKEALTCPKCNEVVFPLQSTSDPYIYMI